MLIHLYFDSLTMQQLNSQHIKRNNENFYGMEMDKR